ncbi:MAG: hypothetical protein WDN69_12835 [Aliidongia sp.]
MDLDGMLLDRLAGPDAFEQFVLGDEIARGLDQACQDCERP